MNLLSYDEIFRVYLISISVLAALLTGHFLCYFRYIDYIRDLNEAIRILGRADYHRESDDQWHDGHGDDT